MISKKLISIIIKIISLIILQFATIFLYGFVIKGNIGILFYCIFILLSFALISLMFKDIAKKSIVAVVFISLFLAFSYGQIYEIINNNDYSSYINEINAEYYEPEGTQTPLDYGYNFETDKGEVIFIRSYNLFFENDSYEDGEVVHLYKYNGKFGVEHYSLTKK